MGNIDSITSMSQITSEKITKNLFDFKYVIGRGGFGKVWKVSYKKTKYYYALKEMSKVKIIDKKSERSIMSERTLLSKLRHPFIVNMICAFQDQNYLYLVMDLLTGGDLRYHLCKYRRFNEIQTKFFMACIILALEYIHSNNILHRDIKPENLVCEQNGYIRVTDFGVAKKYHKNNSKETSGTPGYMAPEVLCAQNHSYPVDYFAIGVLGYEFMLGNRPYLGKNRKEIKNAVLSRQVQIKSSQIPNGWSLDAVDCINRLIQRKVSERLGFNGIEEIKNHPWFMDVDWKLLLEKKLHSPFIPKHGDNFDKSYCESEDTVGEETIERYQIYKRHEAYSTAFVNYTVNNIPVEELQKLQKISLSNLSTSTSSVKKSNNGFTSPSNSSKGYVNLNLSPSNSVSVHHNEHNSNNKLIQKPNYRPPSNTSRSKNEIKFIVKPLNNLSLNNFCFNKINQEDNSVPLSSNNIHIKNIRESKMSRNSHNSSLSSNKGTAQNTFMKINTNSHKQLPLNKCNSQLNIMSPLFSSCTKINLQGLQNLNFTKKNLPIINKESISNSNTNTNTNSASVGKNMRKNNSLLNMNNNIRDKKESMSFQKIDLKNFGYLSPRNGYINLLPFKKMLCNSKEKSSRIRSPKDSRVLRKSSSSFKMGNSKNEN